MSQPTRYELLEDLYKACLVIKSNEQVILRNRGVPKDAEEKFVDGWDKMQIALSVIAKMEPQEARVMQGCKHGLDCFAPDEEGVLECKWCEEVAALQSQNNSLRAAIDKTAVIVNGGQVTIQCNEIGLLEMHAGSCIVGSDRSTSISNIRFTSPGGEVAMENPNSDLMYGLDRPEVVFKSEVDKSRFENTKNIPT